MHGLPGTAPARTPADRAGAPGGVADGRVGRTGGRRPAPGVEGELRQTGEGARGALPGPSGEGAGQAFGVPVPDGGGGGQTGLQRGEGAVGALPPRQGVGELVGADPPGAQVRQPGGQRPPIRAGAAQGAVRDAGQQLQSPGRGGRRGRDRTLRCGARTRGGRPCGGAPTERIRTAVSRGRVNRGKVCRPIRPAAAAGRRSGRLSQVRGSSPTRARTALISSNTPGS